MSKKALTTLIVVIVIIIALLTIVAIVSNKDGGILHKSGTETEESQGNSTSTYFGTLPCADCSGIQTELVFSSDPQKTKNGSYLESRNYLGRSNTPLKQSGTWSVQNAATGTKGSVIVLTPKATSSSEELYLQTTAGALILLGKDGIQYDINIKHPLKKATNNIPDDLTGVTWVWTGGEKIDGSSAAPHQGKEDEFTLTLNENGAVGVTTDCNLFSGYYLINNNSALGITLPISTKKACMQDSQETEYTDLVENTSSYDVSGDTLILHWPDNRGYLSFTASSSTPGVN